jgi:dTDP-4-amino-4,6-dideoxygalactose transaminase
MSTLLTTGIEQPLAEQEWPPIRSRWPFYTEDEIAAAADVLRSGRVNALQHGECNRAFEQAMALLCDMPHAVALANGTLALELGLRALGIRPGDEIVVTPRSFVASASCVATLGAIPVFADVDPVSQNLTAETIERVLTSRTRAIVAVHLAGWPCDMDEIMALARSRNIRVVEDCAQAHGATLRGRPAGSFGDAAAFSFCTDKIISTGGEGGMLLLRDEDVWEKAWSFKDHGKNRRVAQSAGAGQRFRFLHDSFGTNFRLTEMQAAIGLAQLKKLPDWLAARRRNAAILIDGLKGTESVRLALPSGDIGHSYYKFYAFVEPGALATGWDRDRIIGEINARGVPCFSGSCPEIYLEKAFAEAGQVPDQPLQNARRLGETSIMFPVDHLFTEWEMQRIGDVAGTVLRQAIR